MKTVIYYFSGTGNTEKVVREAARSLSALGWNAEVCAIEQAENVPETVAACGSLCIAYPVHAFNAPASVLRFAESLPAQETEKPLYIFKTSGEPLALNNISSYKLRAVLAKKNFVFRGEYHYVMPYNIIFRHSDAMAYRMWETAKRLIPLDCADLAAGIEPPEKKFPFGGMLAGIMRVEHWGRALERQKIPRGGELRALHEVRKDLPHAQYHLRGREIPFRRRLPHVHALRLPLPEKRH